MAEEHRDDNGRAWIAWIDDGYSASLHGGLADPNIYDPGIDGATLAEALSWARARTQWVIVSPEWDSGVHYWAGVGPTPEFHELGQDRVPILPRDGGGWNQHPTVAAMERRGTVYVNWRPVGDEWPPSGEVQWFTSWQDDVGVVGGEDLASVAEAVEWGVARSDRVVVISTDGMAYWAGADPVPEDVAGRWPPGP